MTSRSTVRNDLIKEQEARLTKPASKKIAREPRPVPSRLELPPRPNGSSSTALSSPTTPKQALFGTNEPSHLPADSKELPALSSSNREERHRKFMEALNDEIMKDLSSASQDYLRISFPPLDAARKNDSPPTVTPPRIPASAKSAWTPARPKKEKSDITTTAKSPKAVETTTTCPTKTTKGKLMTAKVSSLKTDQTRV